MARRGFRMTLKSAKELLENPNNCVEKITSERRFALPISFVNKVRNGVSKQLIGETGRYSAKLEGIVLATDNITIISPLASNIDDLPYMIVGINVDFIVFKPRIECSMAGTVTKTGIYYISCLVHGCFNVSIQKTGETELFQQVKVGDSVVVEVVSFQYQGHIVNIQGKLIRLIEKEIIIDQTKAVEKTNGDDNFANCVKKEIETTEGDDETISETEIEIKKQKSPKRKKSKSNGLELQKDNSSIKMKYDSESTPRKHKKKEREYNDEETALNSQLEDELRDEKPNSESELDEKTKRKHKKKKKKEKSFRESIFISEEEEPLNEVEKVKKSRKKKRSELNETANENSTTDYENNSQIAEEEKDELGRKKKKKKSIKK